jgi:uncharacterized membrane protein YgcG
MDSAARLVTIILLASFATERLLACIGWFLDAGLLDEMDEDARRRARAARKRQLVLLTIGGAIALAVVALTGIRVLAQLGVTTTASLLDFVLTWLVLFAGADLIRNLLSGGSGGGGASSGGDGSETPSIRIVVDRDGRIDTISRAS